jgi:hypothetical protein
MATALVAPEVRKTHPASAMLYADIKGFTSMMSRLEALSPDVRARRMRRFVKAWGEFRDALIRPKPKRKFSGFYLANRVGDAFIVLVFPADPKVWLEYVRGYLPDKFGKLARVMERIHPGLTPHLKVSMYTTPEKRVAYYETDVISDEVMGHMTISRRDFFSTAINRCARMDAFPAADTSALICNQGVRDFLVKEAAVSPREFRNLGLKTLRGIESEPKERHFALIGKPSSNRLSG